MVRILWEVSITRVIVLFLSIVTLHVMGWLIPGVFVMINTCILVQIVIVYISHGIIKVEQIMVVMLLQVSLMSLLLLILVQIVMLVFIMQG